MLVLNPIFKINTKSTTVQSHVFIKFDNASIFLVGGGFGLAYLPAIIMVGYYFEKRRAFATGIAVCGSGIGGFVFAPLCVFLINEYAWQGALWVISGIVLNGVIFCCFYRPLPKRRRTIPKETSETNGKCANGHMDPLLQTIKIDLEVENPIYRCKSQEIKVGQNGDLGNNVCRLARSQDICGAQKLHVHHRHVDTLNPLARKDIFYSGSLHHIPEYTESKNECEYVKKMTIKDEEKTKESNSCVQFLKSILLSFDFSLLKSPTFVVYGISCFLCMFGKYHNDLSVLCKRKKTTPSANRYLIHYNSNTMHVSLVINFLNG